MAQTIRIQWRDNAVNETEFFIYRSTNPSISTSDTKIAKLEWSGTSWVASDISSQVSSVSAITTQASPTDVGLFEIEFTDAIQGDNYYGVSASNATGESDVVPTTTSINVT